MSITTVSSNASHTTPNIENLPVERVIQQHHMHTQGSRPLTTSSESETRKIAVYSSRSPHSGSPLGSNSPTQLVLPESPPLKRLSQDYGDMTNLCLNDPFSALTPGTLIFTRPLKELFSHVIHLTCPSRQLLKRVITVLALSIFRWHFCDHVMIKLEDQIIAHSLQGRVDFPDVNLFAMEYSHLVKQALFYKLNDDQPDPVMYKFVSFRSQAEITAQSIRNVFFDAYKIQLTNKQDGNTIWDLLRSHHLHQIELEKM